MSEHGPHCGCTLPRVADAFCPKCRDPLNVPMLLDVLVAPDGGHPGAAAFGQTLCLLMGADAQAHAVDRITNSACETPLPSREDATAG